MILRPANTCNYVVTAKADAYSSTPGASNTATFTANYQGNLGSTQTGVITVSIRPPSNITYTAPPTLNVARNLTLTINALDYITENAAHTVSCNDAVIADSSRVSVSHAGSSCTFTIDPVDALATNLLGETTFDIPFTSSGGDTETGTFTINIGSDSVVTRSPTIPTTIFRGKNLTTFTIDATGWVTDGDYEISCQDATIDNRIYISQITRSGCIYTITHTGAEGSGSYATFKFSSSSGAPTFNVTPTITIGPNSNLIYTTPTGLEVPKNRTITINALDLSLIHI